MREQPTRSVSPEIVGLGALNVDYIAGATTLSEHTAEQVTESNARFEWNREGPVDEETILEVFDRLDAASLSASLGGSAWNTISTLARMRVGIRLGYVGVLGRMVKPGLSFTAQMDRLGIDRTWVGHSPRRHSGLCLSYIDDTDRVMLTYPGANFEVVDHLRRNFTGIASYLASARYVHVTSFLDEETPGEVLRLLGTALGLNPRLRISFDPGYDWAARPGPAVRGILRLADLLFVNYREFKALGHYAYGESDEAIAGKVLTRCRPGCTVFVTKRYDYVQVFRSAADGTVERTSYLEHPVHDAGIEDATGAGDVFSASVLASLVSERLQTSLGAILGLSLARYKSQRNLVRHLDFPDLSRGFLQQTELLEKAAGPAHGILVVHDADPQWRALGDFIKIRCGVPVHELVPDSAGGRGGMADINAYLDRCCFAVCLLNSRLQDLDGRFRTDQSIVHLAGLLQGRYGFGRVAILTEEGCDTFSNIAGLIRLDFPRGRVESTFPELRRMLEREGLIMQVGDRGV